MPSFNKPKNLKFTMFYGNSYNIRSLLEAGVHYGHKKNYWNPKMARFIYGIKNGIHIIDLEQTVKSLERALELLQHVASQDGRILLLSTKKQAKDIIAGSALKCGQYYVNHRWLGGTFTNWRTISSSINTLRKYEKMLADEESFLTKKEKLNLQRKKEKLDLVLGGIRNMGGIPDLLFVIGIRENFTAVREAKKMNIPIIGVIDTNCDPDGIDYPIPGNDDARSAIQLYCDLAAEVILNGMRKNSYRLDDVDVSANVSQDIGVNLSVEEGLEVRNEIRNEELSLSNVIDQDTTDKDSSCKLSDSTEHLEQDEEGAKEKLKTGLKEKEEHSITKNTKKKIKEIVVENKIKKDSSSLSSAKVTQKAT